MQINRPISPKDLHAITQSAYDVINKSGFRPDFVAVPTLAAKRMAVVRFAQAVTKQKYKKAVVLCECDLPEDGYASWLLVRPLGIAYDPNQISGWIEVKGENAPHPEAQVARAIVHELGHIFATPRLLSRRKKRIRKAGGKTFTEPATAPEERDAWVWAIIVFAIALGSHASDRRTKGLCDDTITVPV